MKKTAKKTLSILMSLLMVFSLVVILGLSAAAEDCEHLYGTTGEARYTCVKCGEVSEELYDSVYCSTIPIEWVADWSEDFETDPTERGWTFIDADGDGYNWDWYTTVGKNNPHPTHSGEGMLTSYSYDRSTQTALSPDNIAISPAVTVIDGDHLTFWIKGQGVSSAKEVYRVYIGESSVFEEMTPLSDDLVSGGWYEHIDLDLSGWEGKTVYFAFRHYNVSNMFVLELDDVQLAQPKECPRPEHVFGTEGDDRFVCQNCGWTNETLQTDLTKCGFFDLFADFETDPWAAGWTTDDKDGDEIAWGWYQLSKTHSGRGILGSYSWNSDPSQPMYPDNYAYSPAFTVSEGAKLCYWAAAANANYLGDHFSVYVEADGELTELGEKKEAPEAMTMYEEDLSAYAGKTVRIVFRHYDSHDIWAVVIDDVIVSPAMYDAHDFRATWDWADNNASCIATLICANCGQTHTFAADVEETRTDIIASCIFDGVRYEDAKPSHDHVGGASVIENETPATCTAGGSYEEVVYCTVCDEELSRTTVTTDPTGHSYGGPTWSWNADHSKATATFTCIKGDDVKTVTADATKVEVSAATATADQVVKYTVSVTFDGKTYTTESENVTVPGTATGTPDMPTDPTEPENPTDPDTPSGSNLCKWDNVDHGTSFWGRIVKFFHSILYFFAHLFGRR